MSLLGAFAHLGEVETTRPIYRRAIFAHFAGSLLGASLAGGLLGWIGSSISSAVTAWPFWTALGGLSLILAAREFGWLKFGVPQCRRQTSKMWFVSMGPVRAAWWWGVDLGSGLTTLVTFSGYWILILAILFNGTPGYGALLLGVFALGRAAAVGGVPLLVAIRQSNLIQFAEALLDHREELRRWHGYGLLSIAGVLLLRAIVFA